MPHVFHPKIATTFLFKVCPNLDLYGLQIFKKHEKTGEPFFF